MSRSGPSVIDHQDSDPLLRTRLPSTSYTEPEVENADQMCRANLHIPGRILHITPDPFQNVEESRICGPLFPTPIEKQTFLSTWSDYSRFEEIKLSSKMIIDHWPMRVSAILTFLASQQETPDSLRL